MVLRGGILWNRIWRVWRSVSFDGEVHRSGNGEPSRRGWWINGKSGVRKEIIPDVMVVVMMIVVMMTRMIRTLAGVVGLIRMRDSIGIVRERKMGGWVVE